MPTRTKLAIAATHEGSACHADAIGAAAERWEAPIVSDVHQGLGMARAVLVFEATALRLCDDQGVVRFAHGIAALRAGQVLRGRADPVVTAARLRRGDQVLDGTFGFGADALVAAAAVGPTGLVVGVESSLPIAAFVAEGLRMLPPPWPSAPIEIIHTDVRRYLKETDRCFDVVILDPMFREPRRSHPSFELLRRHANNQPLDDTLLRQAQRHARRGVIAKVRCQTDLDALTEPLTTVLRTRTATWATTAASETLEP